MPYIELQWNLFSSNFGNTSLFCLSILVIIDIKSVFFQGVLERMSESKLGIFVLGENETDILHKKKFIQNYDVQIISQIVPKECQDSANDYKSYSPE